MLITEFLDKIYFFYHRLSIFDMDYHDSVEEAEEVQPAKQNTVEIDKQDEKLLDIDYETKDIKGLEELDMNSSSSNNEITSQSTSNIEHKENLDQLFENLILDNATHSNMQEGNQSEFDRKFGEQSLTMDIFNKSDTNLNLADFSSLEEQNSREQSLQFLTSENMVLLNDILTDKQNADNEWDAISHDTFLPPNILKQSLGDAALGIGQKSMPTINMGDKVSKN